MAESSEHQNISTLTSEEVNCLRIANLVLSVASRAVRVRFDQEFDPAILQKTLNRNRLELGKLKEKTFINKSQWDLLFPVSGKACSISFDLTLMICLIRNLTEISVGDVLPVASDTSEGADLYRLKHYRNMIVHHWDGTLSDKKFEECWTDISQAIVRLGGTSFQQTCSDLKVSRMNNNDEEILKELRNIEISSNPVPRGVRKINGEIIEDWEKDKVVETRAIKRIAQLIDTQNTVVAVGSSGCGKSTSIHYVALQLYHHQGYDILPVYSPEEVRQYYDPDCKQIFVVDDICGKCSIDLNLANCWGRQLTEIKKMLKDQRVKILSSCRTHIFQNRLFKNLSPLFSKSCDLTSDYKLTCTERKDIASIYLTKDEMKSIEGTLCYESKEQTIKFHTPFQQFDFFPLLCSIFSTQKLSNIRDFFNNPVQVFRDDLTLLINANDQKTLATLMLFTVYNNAINETLLSRTSSITQVLETISDNFHLQQCFSIQCVKSELDNLNCSYIKRIGQIYRVQHDKLFEILVLFLSEHKFDVLLDLAHTNIIRDMFVLKSSRETKGDSVVYASNVVEISAQNEYSYFDRLVRDINDGFVENVLNNKQMKYSTFRKKIIKKIKNESNIKSALDNLSKNVISSLYIAMISFGFCEMVEILIDYVDLKKKNDSYDINSITHGLIIASQNGFVDVVKLLLDNEANPNISYTLLSSYCPWTTDRPLTRSYNIVSPLYAAIYYEHSDVVNILLDHNADTNFDGCDGTPLYLAVKKRNIEIVKSLLIYKADPDDSGEYNKPPLYVASENGDSEIVKLLLNYKGNPNVHFYQNKESSLHIAIENDHIETACLLLSHNADPYAFDIDNKTAMFIAFAKGNLVAIRLLASFKKTVTVDTKPILSTILYYASKYGPSDIVKSMIEQTNVDIDDNSHTENKSTPLGVASLQGNTKLVTLLLDHKCNPNITSMYEEAILCNASVLSITTFIRMFCDNNATYENLFKTHTLTPVYIAAMFGHIDIVKLLLEKNCNLNSGDLGSNEYLCDEPILYVAASNGHAEIVKLLLEYGCNPNVRNKFNTTPLHEASCQGHFETVKVLLENNSDTCLINKENDSPLFKTPEGRKKILEVGLKYFFEFKCFESMYKKTPLCIATYLGHTNIVELLNKIDTMTEILYLRQTKRLQQPHR